jgi:NAD(P)-dependent dehydrogenase (short-subunit alcohol dehydrogenase family)
MGSSHTKFNKRSTAEQVMDANVTTTLTGHIVLITGCNTGIGLETAKQYYRKGAHVVMACRSSEKMQEAKKTIEEKVPQTGGVLECFTLDISSLQSIQQFADEFAKVHANDKIRTLMYVYSNIHN